MNAIDWTDRRRSQVGYLQATRHPWPALLFLLPLLAIYEMGVLSLGGAQADVLRNGADAWLRLLFGGIGLHTLYGPPVLIVLILLLWSWQRREDRPGDLFGVWLGMVVECVVLALLLWALADLPVARGDLSVPADAMLQSDRDLALLVCYVGAGIYEEMLFRLLLIPFLVWLLTLAECPRPVALLLAVVLSSLAFAAAHHVGPAGEPYVPGVFLFRFAAGLYFALLFQFRGFGVAVGTHALYDVLVGVAMT